MIFQAFRAHLSRVTFLLTMIASNTRCFATIRLRLAFALLLVELTILSQEFSFNGQTFTNSRRFMLFSFVQVLRIHGWLNFFKGQGLPSIQESFFEVSM